MSKQLCVWDDSFTGELARLAEEVHSRAEGASSSASLATQVARSCRTT